MNEHLNKVSVSRISLICIVILLVTDLLSTMYMDLYWSEKGFSDIALSLALQKNKMHLSDLSPETYQEMIQFIHNAFRLFLVVFILNNLFFYYFFFRKKLWAFKFVHFYVLTAAIINISFIFDDFTLPWYWSIYNLLTIPVYGVLWLVLKVRKNDFILGRETSV